MSCGIYLRSVPPKVKLVMFASLNMPSGRDTKRSLSIVITFKYGIYLRTSGSSVSTWIPVIVRHWKLTFPRGLSSPIRDTKGFAFKCNEFNICRCERIQISIRRCVILFRLRFNDSTFELRGIIHIICPMRSIEGYYVGWINILNLLDSRKHKDQV